MVHPLNNICSPVLKQYLHHKLLLNITDKKLTSRIEFLC